MTNFFICFHKTALANAGSALNRDGSNRNLPGSEFEPLGSRNNALSRSKIEKLITRPCK
jgi:hypothetical protein